LLAQIHHNGNVYNDQACAWSVTAYLITTSAYLRSVQLLPRYLYVIDSCRSWLVVVIDKAYISKRVADLAKQV
jgi:hypothetical protein